MKFLIDFLGCKVNSYEVEAVANDLMKHGFIEIKKDSTDTPDLIIINTCAVTETSSSKSKKMIRQYRIKYRDAIICVMGCFSQYEGDYVINNLKANIVLGTNQRSKIFDYINEFLTNRQPILIKNNALKDKTYENISLDNYFDKTRAFLKIQDGCNNFCTYCLIPFVRGPSRSRPIESILNEVKKLINNGYKEIILTGIDQGSYGLDFNNGMTFSKLLKEILINNPDLYRLRISSIEESQIDEDFINLLKDYPNIANHLHIPLQSGSSKILKLMHRKYNLENYILKIDKIRKIKPDISITTDVIVGFPGETEEDFEATLDFIRKINFAKVHVFPYSDRNGSAASKFPNKVSDIEKKNRVNRLIELSDELEHNYENKFYGKDIDFLFESYDSRRGGYKGHSSNYLECFIKSDINIKDKILNITFKKDNSCLD